MFSLTLVYFTYKLMDNLRRYQICHDLITYFAALIFPKKSQLDLIFRGGGRIISCCDIANMHASKCTFCSARNTYVISQNLT